MLQWPNSAALLLAVVALIVAGGAVIFALSLRRQLAAVRAQYNDLTLGADGGSLDALLNQHMESVRAALTQARQASETATRMEELGHSHVQHVALLRYNPFSHTGGDQSFVLALADRNGDGALINSLHARDGTRVYAKPLAGWGSPYTLTVEEEEAIGRARGEAVAVANGKV